MLLNPITAANKAPEKLTLLLKCGGLVLFLIIMLYFSIETQKQQPIIPSKGFIQAPMNNAGNGILQTAQPLRSQGPAVFIASGSN